MTTRIGHLSDIHVPALEPFSLRDLFSKRVTGFLNFKLKRQKEYEIRVLQAAVQQLIDARVDLVIVSGDLTNLAYRQEFETAKKLLSPLSDAQIPWFVVPGNHDRYLAAACDGRMEHIFQDHLGEALGDDAYPWLSSQHGATIIGLNSAVPNAPFQAWGEVSQDQLHALEAARTRIQSLAQPIVIVVHHHLGKAPNKKNDANRNLRNSDQVLALAQKLGAQLVIHGHNHFLDIQDMGAVRVFAASSGISNQQGEHRSAGQVAIHTVTNQAPPRHEVAYWQGEAFGDWTEVSPQHLPPRA